MPAVSTQPPMRMWKKKQTNTESRNTEKNGGTANKTKKNQKTAHSSGSSALRRQRAIEVYQPKQNIQGKKNSRTSPGKKRDYYTQHRFISAAQEQGKVSSQPVSPYQCALSLNVVRT
jgi:hypothetical protein